jgi:hypothetical protein
MLFRHQYAGLIQPNLNLGAELLGNPSFADATVWAGTDALTLFSISGGNLTITQRADPGNPNGFLEGVAQTVASIGGTKTYYITATLNSVTAGSGGLRIKVDEYDLPTINGITGTSVTATALWTSSPSTFDREFIISTSSANTSLIVGAVSMRQVL